MLDRIKINYVPDGHHYLEAHGIGSLEYIAQNGTLFDKDLAFSNEIRGIIESGDIDETAASNLAYLAALVRISHWEESGLDRERQKTIKKIVANYTNDEKFNLLWKKILALETTLYNPPTSPASTLY